MTLLLIIISMVLVGQVVLFIVTRKKIKKEKANNVLQKYNIKTRSELWKTLNDPELPEEDRAKLEQLYAKET